MKTKGKKKLFLMLCVALVAALFVAVFASAANATTAEAQSTDDKYELQAQTEAQERGLFTNISIGVSGSLSHITATAKNEFTLGPSTIKVIVKLYSSNEFQNSADAMTLVSSDSTPDLNIFEQIQTSAPTGGVQKYWRGRVEYKFDTAAWKIAESDTFLFHADGTRV